MSALSVQTVQPLLPGLYHAEERRRGWVKLDPKTRLVTAAQTLCSAMDKVSSAADQDTVDQAIARDRRFRLAQSIALPLTLGGPVRRLESFRTLVALATKASREIGVAGPAGLALKAASLLAEAVLGPPEAAAMRLEQAIDAAIEAAVAHAVLHGGDVVQTRASAERMAAAIPRSRKPH